MSTAGGLAGAATHGMVHRVLRDGTGLRADAAMTGAAVPRGAAGAAVLSVRTRADPVE